MAQETRISRLIGRSGEIKPVTLADGSALGAGSEFFETDTFALARFDGVRWVQDRNHETNSAEILAEAKRTNELLELLLTKL